MAIKQINAVLLVPLMGVFLLALYNTVFTNQFIQARLLLGTTFLVVLVYIALFLLKKSHQTIYLFASLVAFSTIVLASLMYWYAPLILVVWNYFFASALTVFFSAIAWKLYRLKGFIGLVSCSFTVVTGVFLAGVLVFKASSENVFFGVEVCFLSDVSIAAFAVLFSKKGIV